MGVARVRKVSHVPDEPQQPVLTHLRLERPADGVAVLVLDDPGRRNAMSEEMTDSWVRAVDAIAADPTVRCVVVTGEGTAFCSGGNTGWIASEPDATRRPSAPPDDRLLPGLAVRSGDSRCPPSRP